MNNVKMYQAHKDPVRGLRWEPSGQNLRHFTFNYVSTWQYSCQPLVAASRVVACENKVDNATVATSGQTHVVCWKLPGLIIARIVLCLTYLLQIYFLCNGIVVICKLHLLLFKYFSVDFVFFL